jgi:pyrroline-5-carboxylate reductase
VGQTITVNENQIDALGTISGSGPAYVFYLIEQLTKAAQSQGFSAEQASLMVNETFLGASLLLDSTNQTPAELRRQVTSPNGTTERAIAELEKADIQAIFETATSAALARSKEIAAGKQ